MTSRTLQLAILSLALSFICFNLYGQGCSAMHGHSEKKEALLFIPNQNQWHSNVEYKVDLEGINTLYLEKNKLTWHFHDSAILKRMHNNKSGIDTMTWTNHAYQVQFLGASKQVNIRSNGKQNTYHNYFKGNDSNRWAEHVPVFHGVVYEELYDGINMAAYSQNGNFKYDFIVEPGVNPSVIQLAYEGTDGLSIKDGNLLVETSVAQIKEQKPYAYQLINNKEIAIICNYKLENNIVSFQFPNGYNNEHPLIIDPVVVAATLSGGLSDNWGYTATYDNAGNIYAGGASFGPIYPTTLGAFQTNFAGGNRDIAITKYNPDGSQQIYATYIGGNGTDQPHSMIVDINGQLCIYGFSNSTNYPVSSSAFQTNNSAAGNAEIIITKLNAEGSELVGSTYLGGSSIDGLNQSAPNTDDANRGEIVLDAQNNIYIVSSSLSDDFPVTANAFQTTNNGNQDVVVAKFNTDLSTLFWSTYLGGSADDTGLGIRIQDDGKIIVTGMAGSQNFPIGNNGYQPNWPGGQASVFIVKLSNDGQNIENSTFFGTDGDDYSYFVDLDEDDNIHIYGQTTGVIDITPDAYFFMEESGQFLAGFSPDLSQLNYSTVIGLGNNAPFFTGFDFVPVAFMVDKCNSIYLSGYHAYFGLPTTSDAIESTGNDVFYFAQFSPNAATLEFATYYGNSNHVDGGTSRFDKSGVIYQAVCSCVPENRIMNTLPNAYSQTSSTNCSIGVLKIDFEIETITASAYAEPSTSGCVPLPVNFFYSGANANSLFWDFGTGDTSTEQNPSYTFLESGTYTVMQIAENLNTCNLRDTFFIEINVLDNNSTVTDTVICTDLFLDVSTFNSTYTWQDGTSSPTYYVTDPGTYWVDIGIGNCSRRDSFIVTFFDNVQVVDLGPDQVLCDETSVTIGAPIPEAISYEWSNGNTDPTLLVTNSGDYSVTVTYTNGCQNTDETNIIFSVIPDVELGPDTTLCEGENLILTPITNNVGVVFSWQDGSAATTYSVTTEGWYWVTVELDGCTNTDSIYVNYLSTPIVEYESTEILCHGDSASISAITPASSTANYTFNWSNGSTEADISNLPAGSYQVTISNSNGCSYQTEINLNQPDPLEVLVSQIDVECYNDGNGEILVESTTGGTQPYQYSLNGDPLSDIVVYNDLNGGSYTLLTQDANNCEVIVEIDIYEPPMVFLSAGEDKTIDLGCSVRIDGELFPSQNQIISWTSPEFLDCPDCIRPYSTPYNSVDHIITVVDSISGCTYTDIMSIFVNKPRNIFIPNAFSPNGDGFNDLFFPFGDKSAELVTYFKIFDRWGELVYEIKNVNLNDSTAGWDGRMGGKAMNPGVFVYILEIQFIDGVLKLFKGDVTILK